MTISLKGKLDRYVFFLCVLTVVFFSSPALIRAATENSSTGSTCSDKIDNDGDKSTDAADPGCDSAVDKQNLSIKVSTVDQDNWYDEADKSLHTFAVCDNNDDAPYNTPGCNSDNIHDDYYSTDTPNEENVAPAEKKFTIKVDAADSFGIDKIKIEWINVSSPDPDDWSCKNTKKGSFTCDDSGSCTICTNGGGCKNDVIDPSFFKIENGAKQRRFFFRATITDNNGNSVTTGFDDSKNAPVLDKFYRFVVCGTDCHASACDPANNAPTVSLDGYDQAANFCDGLNYRLKWKFTDADGDKQAFYSVEVREKGTTAPVYAVSRQSADHFCQVFDGIFTSGNIGYGKTYEWRVKVSDDDDRALCRGTSDWSAWSDADDSFKTPLHPYPKTSFVIENAAGKACTPETCGFLEDIGLRSTSSTSSTSGTVTYRWFIDDMKATAVFSTDANAVRKFLEAEGESHSIRLSVTDGDGYTCSADQNLVLKKSNAVWNEVAPGQK